MPTTSTFLKAAPYAAALALLMSVSAHAGGSSESFASVSGGKHSGGPSFLDKSHGHAGNRGKGGFGGGKGGHPGHRGNHGDWGHWGPGKPDPVSPVPEPGTLALAAAGLLAVLLLGRRKLRG